MSFSELFPADIGAHAALAICAFAFIAGATRGFSGFGAAMIFMPLASSVAGALVGVTVGTYFLSRLDPMTTRWIISCFVGALLLLLLSGWRCRGKDHVALSVGIGALSGFCAGLARTGGPPIVGYWLGRPVARANVFLFFGACDFFSVVSYAVGGLMTRDAILFSLVVGPVYGIGVRLGASWFGRASEAMFRGICYALIALAVLFGLPALDGVLRLSIIPRDKRQGRLRAFFRVGAAS
jgi:uncharacterized membrane protein YfcA